MSKKQQQPQRTILVPNEESTAEQWAAFLRESAAQNEVGVVATIEADGTIRPIVKEKKGWWPFGR